MREVAVDNRRKGEDVSYSEYEVIYETFYIYHFIHSYITSHSFLTGLLELTNDQLPTSVAS